MASSVTTTLSSSSTISSDPLGIGGGASNRQGDGEGRAPTGLAAHLDVAAVAAHDAVRDPESKPAALLVLLGGEERLEDVGHVLLGDPGPRVPNLDVHGIGTQKLRIGVAREVGRNVDVAAVGHSLLGIQE